jgi:L-amino acid N-acyltransferase YncA
VVSVIRAVDVERDNQRCAEIFAPYAEGPTAFVDRAPTSGEMRAEIVRTTATHPWFVAEDDGLVIGYAYASPHRSRPGYRWSTEVSAYVDPTRHGQGIGRSLYTTLLHELAQQGYHTALAGITLPNGASVALHESLGFTPVGIYHEVGWKAGAWRDVGWWERRL